MNVGSLFSGIGGIDLGLERAGMRVLWQCEADPWRRAVLRWHWPDTLCYEDVGDVGRDLHGQRLLDRAGPVSTDESRRGSPKHHAADLLCGGFPCQDLSVAGRRAGLDGARSSLFFEFARIADALRPRWLLVENVPGLFSSQGGRDFAVVLATLAELGYGVCWRVLDSRHFGVPQRRRRVFVVGHLGATSAAPFLPFLEGGEGDSAASGATGADVAVASLSGLGSGGPDDNDGSAVRRLTPTECCRLQSFPDNWLGEPNEPPDSPRYAALGDAVTVNVAHWIGTKIMKAEAA